MTVSAEAEEVVIPEYSTVDYDVDFQYELDGIDALKETCDQQGTVEELTYEAPAYATNELLGTDSTIEKTVQVYLPYGYDESKQYNVLYLLHGTGGNDKYWFETAKGADGSENVTSNVLDNMIKEGLCDPVIVVTPNFYSEIMDKDHKISDDAVVEYGKEKGDFKVDGKYTFEVGGPDKGFSQIAGVKESYVLADDIESPSGRRIPLWMLGFIY